MIKPEDLAELEVALDILGVEDRLRYAETQPRGGGGGSTGGGTWGSITGTISDQTDLQTALDDKYDASNPDGYINTETDPVFTAWNDPDVAYLTPGTAATTYEPLLPATPTNPETQFLNGNKEWAPIAIGAGGFAGNLYFTTIDSDVAGYKTFSYSAEAVETTLAVTLTNTEVLARTYLFESPLELDEIDAGMWVASYRVKVSGTAGVTQLKFEAFVRHADTTETTLFSSYSPEINNTDFVTLRSETTQPLFDVAPTDRLGVRIYAKSTHAAPITISTIIGDGNGSYFTTPLRVRHNQLRAWNEDPDYQHINGTDRALLDDLEAGIPLDHSTLSNLDYSLSGHTGFQQQDAGLTSLAGLTYASPAFVKMTGADTFTLDTATYEPSLGNPLVDGYVLASTAGGVRSWVEMGSGGGGAPTSAFYVTLATDGTLTQERVLTGTTNQISITDNGAGNTVVLSLPQDIHTSATPTFGRLTLTAGTTTSTLLSTSATWNSAGTTHTGWLLNVTNTASAAASKLIDLKETNVSRFTILPNGRTSIIGGTTTTRNQPFLTVTGTWNYASNTSQGVLININNALSYSVSTLLQVQETNVDRFIVYSWGKSKYQSTITGAIRDALEVNSTWNSPGGICTGLNLNITDTASYSSSMFLNCLLNGVSKFYVSKQGVPTATQYVVSGGVMTNASNPVFGGSATWNGPGVVFNGFFMNITDTASHSSSKLLDLQVGSVSKFSVQKDGKIASVATQTNSTPQWSFTGELNCSHVVDSFKIDVLETSVYPGSTLFTVKGSGNQLLSVGKAEVTINEAGLSRDFRVEGDTDANALFVDGSADTVQVGAATASDSAKFYVNGKISTSDELEVNGALNHDGTTVGLYGVAPVARATTAGAAATFVANTSGITNDTATFDGYTIGQIVKALRNIGVLT